METPWAAATSPSANAESDTAKASHGLATEVICIPAWEKKALAKSSLNCGMESESNGLRHPRAESTTPSGGLVRTGAGGSSATGRA